MTNDEMTAALDLIEEKFDGSFLNDATKMRDRLSEKVGRSNKRRNIEINAVLFLKVMIGLGGTYVWKDGPNKGYKFTSIFDALAAEMPEFKDFGLAEQAAHVEEYGPRLAGGYRQTRRWLDEWFMETVYAVPEDKESGQPTVLTFDPNHRLRSGRTAAEMQSERDIKLATGQIRSSASRLASSNAKPIVRTKMNEILERVMAELDTRTPKWKELTQD